MQINTKFSDVIEAKDEDIITFDEGLLGLEDVKKFILINISDDGAIKYLQSVDNQEIAFVVVNPWKVLEDYEIDIDDNELSSLGSVDLNNYELYTIVTMGRESITTNLIGPVIINMKTGKGKQFVLYKSKYTTKHNITDFIKRV